MLPNFVEIPAGAVLLVSGFIACFVGYRLFKFVVGVYGFILGAAITSSTMGVTSTGGMILAAIFGGTAGAIILVLAYFVGVALVGAGFGVLVAHAGWSYLRGTNEPALTAIVGFAVLGAVGAMLLQRYVVIVATAFGGAWTMLLGGLWHASEAYWKISIRRLPHEQVERRRGEALPVRVERELRVFRQQRREAAQHGDE